MAHQLPPLPYAFDALEPHIDARTMEIHHGKHHAAYVTNLNKALEGRPDLQALALADLIADLDAVPEEIRSAVRNHGGGHLNHSLFWHIMGPGKGGEPAGAFATVIRDAFGGFAAFKDRFAQAAMGQFGSGWAWLTVRDGKIEILSTPNQDNPISGGRIPILGIDVWEHAYYLKYQNRRAEYIAAWWNVVDWKAVAMRYETAKKSAKAVLV